MSDKSTIRYLGYRSLDDGGREFDFSCAYGAEKPSRISVETPSSFFQGPDRIVLQEAAGICYETLKCRLQTEPVSGLDRFDLTSADVLQHRKVTKALGSRR